MLVWKMKVLLGFRNSKTLFHFKFSKGFVVKEIPYFSSGQKRFAHRQTWPGTPKIWIECLQNPIQSDCLIEKDPLIPGNEEERDNRKNVIFWIEKVKDQIWSKFSQKEIVKKQHLLRDTNLDLMNAIQELEKGFKKLDWSDILRNKRLDKEMDYFMEMVIYYNCMTLDFESLNKNIRAFLRIKTRNGTFVPSPPTIHNVLTTLLRCRQYSSAIDLWKKILHLDPESIQSCVPLFVDMFVSIVQLYPDLIDQFKKVYLLNSVEFQSTFLVAAQNSLNAKTIQKELDSLSI